MKKTLICLVLILSFQLTLEANKIIKVMGWKISVLIIKKNYDKEVNKITEDLGLGKSSIVGETTLNRSLYPNNLCIGFHDGKTIITHGAILMEFFNEEPSKIELTFSDLFKDTDMLALVQVEGAGISGFSYIKNGKRVRTKLVGDEEGEIRNLGDALETEEGVDDYDLPFHLPQMFFNQRLDDDLILNTKMYVLKLEE